MTEAVSAPQGPVTLQIGEISFLNDKAVKIGHHDFLFVNGCNVSGFKIGDKVNAKIQGNKLTELTHRAEEQHPGEMKTGSGKISVIDLNKPYFEYTYTYQGNPVPSKFFQVSDAAKATLANYKVGDEITATWTVHDGNKKVLQNVGPKVVKPAFGGGGWKGTPKDPAAEAKKQRMIVRQNVLDRAVELWIATKPADTKNATENDLKSILFVAERFEEWVMRE